MPTIAIIANTGLGDALWMTVCAHNYAQAGYTVTLYSTFLTHLQSLFPHFTILPYPETLPSSFDKFLFQQYSPFSRTKPLPPHATVLHKEQFDLSQSYVANLTHYCKQQLGHATPTTGIQIPSSWRYRHNPHQIILQPLSADPSKNWRPSQFIALATHLSNQGYHPLFVLPPTDLSDWQDLLRYTSLPEPLSLPWLALAQLLYESGHFIGNDASPGHLASILNIPTLTLFSRKSRATLYRPSFSPGEVVLPYALLPGRTLRSQYWQYFLPVKKALKAFERTYASPS